MVFTRLFLIAILPLITPVLVRGQPFRSKVGDALRTDLFGDPLPKGAIARMGTVRFRGGSIYTLVWSPDGNTLASSGYITGSIRLWDVASGKELRRFVGECGDKVLAWSPDGKFMASGFDDDDPTIHLWDVASGKQIRSLDGDHSFGIESLAWSPDSKILAAGNNDNTIRLWDPVSSKEICRIRGHAEDVTSVAWSPGGKLLASSSYDKTIRLWQAATGKEVRRFRGHTHRVSSVAWSPDGKTLVSSSWDHTVRFWNVATGKEIRRLDGASSAALSPDGKILALNYGEETRLWELATGRMLRTLAGKQLESVVWSPDSKILASRREDTIHLWDAATGQEIRPCEGHENTVTSIGWSPDSKILASGSYDNTIRLWNPDTGKPIRTLIGHRSPICTICWSPDGKTLASGSTYVANDTTWSDKKTIRLWDPAIGNEVRHMIGPERDVNSLAWSPDGKTLASGSADKTIRLWNSATGKEIRRITVPSDNIEELVWSPDGKTLAAVYLVESNSERSKYDSICLFDPANGKKIRRIDNAENIASLAWSPDGKNLVAACYDKPVRRWDAASGKVVYRFTGRNQQIRSVPWSPDGKTLTSRDGDGTIGLWETVSGKQIQRLIGHDGSITSLAWSPDGKRSASGGGDTTLLIWTIGRQANEPFTRLTLSQLQSCWRDLASEDAAKAYQAIVTLSRGGEDSARFLAERLKPVPPADPQRVARLLEELDSEQFVVRQHASNELKQLAERAEAAMNRALSNHPTLESRKRMEQLLSDLDIWSGERLRALRAVTVLERIATAEARKVLESLANGAAVARVTQEAKASLSRLDAKRKGA